MAAWWIKNHARWQREQDALSSAGIGFVLLESTKRLVLEVTVQLDGQPIKLVAQFPTEYPSFPPTVTAPGLALVRHLNPITKHLCLLPREGDDWQPESDTLAWLLTVQLNKVFQSQPAANSDGAIVETLQGEPVTAFMQTQPGSFIGFPAFSFAQLPTHGTFLLGLESLRPLRGTVIELKDEGGTTALLSDSRASTYYEGRAPILQGRWVRLDSRPPVTDAESYYELAAAQLSSLGQPNWQSVGSQAASRIDVIALLFEDELSWRESAGNAIVISKLQQTQGAQGRTKIEPSLHRAELDAVENYFVRNPSARLLQKGTVALAGTGSIGSVAAKLLAQAGIGNLRLVDQDVVESGNGIRWEIGRSAAGLHKVEALGQLITSNFPYTKVSAIQAKIGDAGLAGTPLEVQLDDMLFRGVTCIFDATASMTVGQYLSEKAMRLGIPYIWMYATNGAWGGAVGIARPGRANFCWMCHLHELNTPGVEPLCRAPEEAGVQPPGCLDPTFTGAQVDLAEVALMGTRLVIDEVLACVSSSERAFPWTFARLSLRDDSGRPHVPSWLTFDLRPLASCPNHN